jgi:hypothetical protein
MFFIFQQIWVLSRVLQQQPTELLIVISNETVIADYAHR